MKDNKLTQFIYDYMAGYIKQDDIHYVNVRTDAHDNDALRVCERYMLGGQRVTKFMTFDKPGNIH